MVMGEKTVFDPFPYDFRIMSQNKSITLRHTYFKGSGHTYGLVKPLSRSLYGGSFMGSDSGGNDVKFTIDK